MRRATLLALAGAAGLALAASLRSSSARRAAVEDDAAAALAATVLPTEDVDGRVLREASAAVRRVGGDPGLVEALDEAAVLSDTRSAPPDPTRAVVCASWSTCSIYARPDPTSELVLDADPRSMRAVEHRPDGWTRVFARRRAPLPGLTQNDPTRGSAPNPAPASGPEYGAATALRAGAGAPGFASTPSLGQGLVIDPYVPPAGEVSGWVPTLELENAATTPAVIGRASTVQFGDTREVGRWITSPVGQLVIGTALGAASALIPGAWLAIPLFAFIKSAVQLAIESLIQALGRVLLNERFDKAIFASLMYQFGQAANAVLDNPRLLERVGFELPANLKAIGSIKSMAIRYLTSTFVQVADIIGNPRLTPAIQDAIRLAAAEAIDVDTALEKMRLSPSQIALNTPIYTIAPDGRVVQTKMREDAVAQGINAQLGRVLYPIDWFRPSDGRMVTDKAQLLRLLQWEYERAGASRDVGEKARGYERVRILARQIQRQPRGLPLYKRGQQDRTGPDDLVTLSSAELLQAFNSATVARQSPKIQTALRRAYEKRLAEETETATALAAGEAARQAEIARVAAADAARRPDRIFDPGRPLGAEPRDLRTTPLRAAATIAAATAPLWSTLFITGLRPEPRPAPRTRDYASPRPPSARGGPTSLITRSRT